MPSTVHNHKLAFELKAGEDTPTSVFLRADQPVLAKRPEAYVAASLFPAMNTGSDLSLSGPIDPQFAQNLDTIQDIYSTWHDEAEGIAIHADTRPPSSSPHDGRTAAFFTGGVDSFYTLLKHEEEIDTLVLVHGFDMDLADEKLRTQVSEMVQDVGATFDKEVVELETNLRDFGDRYTAWGKHYHGAALAFVGLSFHPGYDQFLIASSLPYDQLRPWGSHPLLDPRWSTTARQFHHDGCEASRADKCKVVGGCDAALRALRVCWKNPNSAYNCGRCEKCIRTMVQLLSVGALDRCPTFDQGLDPDVVYEDKGLRASMRQKHFHYHNPIQLLRETGRAPEMVEAIDAALNGPSRWERLRSKCSRLFRRFV